MTDRWSRGVVGQLPPDAWPGLLRAVDGLRNLRAFVAMLGCLVIGVLLAGICSLIAARLGLFFGFLGGLCMFVAAATGINAAGVLLYEQARGQPSRGLGPALRFGLACVPKFLLLALTLLLVAFAVFLALGLAYLICKIPVLGPVLFVAVFPLSVLIGGLTLSGLFLCMVLALPDIWEDAPILRALTQSLAIVRTRGVESMLMLVVVGLLALLVAAIAFSVLFTGLMPALMMSASIFGSEALGAVVGTLRNGTGEGSPYALAAGVGAMLLWALTGTLFSLVSLLGLGIIHLRVTDGLDVSGTQDALRAGLEEARRQAAEISQRAREAAERARTQARATRPPEPTVPPVPPAAPSPTTDPRPSRAAPPESTAPSVAKALTCPQCLSAVGKEDVFCAACGYKLRG